jgi:hypothetical protein
MSHKWLGQGHILCVYLSSIVTWVTYTRIRPMCLPVWQCHLSDFDRETSHVSTCLAMSQKWHGPDYVSCVYLSCNVTQVTWTGTRPMCLPVQQFHLSDLDRDTSYVSACQTMSLKWLGQGHVPCVYMSSNVTQVTLSGTSPMCLPVQQCHKSDFDRDTSYMSMCLAMSHKWLGQEHIPCVYLSSNVTQLTSTGTRPMCLGALDSTAFIDLPSFSWHEHTSCFHFEFNLCPIMDQFTVFP